MRGDLPSIDFSVCSFVNLLPKKQAFPHDPESQVLSGNRIALARAGEQARIETQRAGAGFRDGEIKLAHLDVEILKTVEDEGENRIVRANGELVMKLPIEGGKCIRGAIISWGRLPAGR